MSLKTISRLRDVLTPGNTREALLGWYNATQFETDKNLQTWLQSSSKSTEI